MAEHASLQVVIHRCLNDYAQTHRLSPRQWQVCAHIGDCRTAALGGFDWVCDACGHHQHLYHACRDRHCPRCQRSASEQWCDRQREAVLPVTYYHVVFTLPHELNAWVSLHDRLLYALLFEAVWSTLSTFAADPKRLDGRLGMTAVLHTWGQTLTRHVHLHCLIPGGAIGADGSWHAARSTMLFPVRALARHVRGGLVSRLRAAAGAGKLERIAAGEVDAVLDRLMRKDWVVDARPCFGGAETVVDYLGRYSHRTAITDGRLLGFDGERVRLAYKDYRDEGRHKVMTLDAAELLRRFLLHVLPAGFMRVRHFGFLANRCRKRCLAQIRSALAAAPPDDAGDDEDGAPAEMTLPCPKCRRGRMHAVSTLPARAPMRGHSRLDGG